MNGDLNQTGVIREAARVTLERTIRKRFAAGARREFWLAWVRVIFEHGPRSKRRRE